MMANSKEETSEITGSSRLHLEDLKASTYVIDADKRPVGCNFKLSDWQAMKDASQVFAEALDNEPSAIRLTEAFLKQWVALKVGEQRKLLDQILFLPLSGYVQKKPRASRQMAAQN